MGHLKVTVAHPRVTIGYLKATVVHIRVKLGHLSRVTIGYFFSISKHKANTTELHPKVRQTCSVSNRIPDGREQVLSFRNLIPDLTCF